MILTSEDRLTDAAHRASQAAWDMQEQRDSARRWAVAFEQDADEGHLRVANACAIVDAMACLCTSTYTAETDELAVSTCVKHQLDDALRGVR